MEGVSRRASQIHSNRFIALVRRVLLFAEAFETKAQLFSKAMPAFETVVLKRDYSTSANNYGSTHIKK